MVADDLAPQSTPRLVLEPLPLPVMVLDGQDRLLFANAAARAAHGDPPSGASLAECAPGLRSSALDGTPWRLAVGPAANERRLAELASAAADSGKLAHEIRNAHTAVHLALRAVGKALGEDERAVIGELAERLEEVERRVREAVGTAPE
ncbi:MAG: hypothetical protein QF903_15465 [Planctomycetota bacterium]|nr:hypothetical protein [Planctomycetota bacterium]MDP6990867.1 hypothetical protein [Planctomycetota bacterium]